LLPHSKGRLYVLSKLLEIAGPAQGQEVRLEVVGGDDLLDVVGALEIHGQPSRLGKIDINRPCNERPGERSVGGRLPTDLPEAGGTVEVAGKLQAKILAGLRFHAGLDDAVHFLVPKEIVEGRRPARIY